MSALTRLANAWRVVFTWSAEIASVLILVMVLLGAADVLGRYLMSKPVPGAYEITETLMVFIVFLGFAHADAKGQHIRIQILDKRITERQRYLLDNLACLLGILILSNASSRILSDHFAWTRPASATRRRRSRRGAG